MLVSVSGERCEYLSVRYESKVPFPVHSLVMRRGKVFPTYFAPVNGNPREEVTLQSSLELGNLFLDTAADGEDNEMFADLYASHSRSWYTPRIMTRI